MGRSLLRIRWRQRALETPRLQPEFDAEDKTDVNCPEKTNPAQLLVKVATSGKISNSLIPTVMIQLMILVEVLLAVVVYSGSGVVVGKVVVVVVVLVAVAVVAVVVVAVVVVVAAAVAKQKQHQLE